MKLTHRKQCRTGMRVRGILKFACTRLTGPSYDDQLDIDDGILYVNELDEVFCCTDRGCGKFAFRFVSAPADLQGKQRAFRLSFDDSDGVSHCLITEPVEPRPEKPLTLLSVSANKDLLPIWNHAMSLPLSDLSKALEILRLCALMFQEMRKGAEEGRGR